MIIFKYKKLTANIVAIFGLTTMTMGQAYAACPGSASAGNITCTNASYGLMMSGQTEVANKDLSITMTTDSYSGSVRAIDTRGSNSKLTLLKTDIKIIRSGNVTGTTHGAYWGSYSGHQMTMGDNSSITIDLSNMSYVGSSNNVVYGVEVNGGSSIDFGKNSTFNIDNSSQTGYKNAYAINAHGGGKVNLQEGLTIDIKGNGTEAKNTAAIFSSGGGYIELNGANNITSTISGGERGLALYAFGGSTSKPSTIKGNHAVYHINGNVLASSDGLIDMSFANGSTINGDITVERFRGTKLNFDMNGTVLTGKATVTAGTLNLNLNDASTWNMTGDSSVTTLNFDNADSRVKFKGTGGYNTLTVADLSGTGVFEMRSDMPNIVGDKILVTKSSAGAHTLEFNDAQTGGNTGHEELQVVEFTGSGANNATFSGQADSGAYVYSVEQKADGNWYLMNGQGGGPDPGPGPNPTPTPLPKLTNIAQHSAGLLSTNYLLGHVETQTLLQRMGDLRNSKGTGDVWGRIYAGKLDSFNNKRISNYDMDYNGMQMGVDRQIDTNSNGRVYVGLAAGYGEGKVDYLIGDGKTTSYHLGAYATYQSDNDWYMDGLLKYTRMNNKINTFTTGGYGVHGKGNTNGFSLGVEVGKRFYFNPEKTGFYLEPQGQITFGKQNGATITSSNGLRTDLGSYTSVLGRGSVLFGYNISKNNNPINIYFKTGFVKEFDGKTSYTFNYINKERYDFDSSWWDNGIGINAQIGNRHHIYAEADYAKGGNFDRKQFNVSYRMTF